MLVWCKTRWGWPKKIETCRSISGLYVKVYILTLVNLLVLSIKLLIKARMWILLISQVLSLLWFIQQYVLYWHPHYMPCLSHCAWFPHCTNIWRRKKFIKIFINQFSPASCYIRTLSLTILTSPTTVKICSRNLIPE